MRANATGAAWIAHTLAWIGAVALMTLPFYEGVVGTDGSQRSVEATLIEVNGMGVVPVLLTPVLLTGLGLIIAARAKGPSVGARLGLWAMAGLLALFAVASLLSIGIFYVPAALTLLLAPMFRMGSPAPEAVATKT